MRRPIYVTSKPNKRLQRMQQARDRLFHRKVSEISKARAVQYATAAFVMTMSELYGWAAVRSGRVIDEAMEKWGSYTKEDELKLLDAAKSIGVDVAATTELSLSEESYKMLNMTKQTFQNFQDAINDVHLMMSACLVCLHDYHHFGEVRLNKIMNHMWKQYLRACENDGKSIMDMCEEETGICIAGGEA